MVAKCVISNANSLRWFDQVQAPCEKQTSKAVSRRPIRIHGQNISSKGKARTLHSPWIQFPFQLLVDLGRKAPQKKPGPMFTVMTTC